MGEPTWFKNYIKSHTGLGGTANGIASTMPNTVGNSVSGEGGKEALQSTLQGVSAKLGLSSDSSSSSSSSGAAAAATKWSTPAPLPDFGAERRHRWSRFWNGQEKDAASKPLAEAAAARKVAEA